MKMLSKGYTLWLMPKGENYNRFANLIKHLAREYKGPIFEPHVTLLGDIELSEEETVKRMGLLVKNQKQSFVTLKQIDFEDFYFRALFVKADITNLLLALHERAKELFGMQHIPPYMPHLSLLYGNYPTKAKQEIIAKLGREQPAQFEVNCVHLVKGGKVEDWKVVREFIFS